MIGAEKVGVSPPVGVGPWRWLDAAGMQSKDVLMYMLLIFLLIVPLLLVGMVCGERTLVR